MSSNSNDKIIDIIEPIFQDLFLNEKLKITKNTSPENIEEWDSLAHISLLSAVEQKLSIQFTAEEMSSIQDVSGIIKIAEERGNLL